MIFVTRTRPIATRFSDFCNLIPGHSTYLKERALRQSEDLWKDSLRDDVQHRLLQLGDGCDLENDGF